jgi:hypothetical protein
MSDAIYISCGLPALFQLFRDNDACRAIAHLLLVEWPGQHSVQPRNGMREMVLCGWLMHSVALLAFSAVSRYQHLPSSADHCIAGAAAAFGASQRRYV